MTRQSPKAYAKSEENPYPNDSREDFHIRHNTLLNPFPCWSSRPQHKARIGITTWPPEEAK
jgi:hypothetical protein